MAGTVKIYELEGPDGRIYEVEGPEGATAEELGAFIQSQDQQAVSPTPTRSPRVSIEGAPPEQPRPRSAPRAVNDTQTSVEMGLDRVAEEVAPRGLSDSDAAEFARMRGDPNVPLADIAAFMQSRTAGADIMFDDTDLQGIQQYRDELAAGGFDPSGTVSYRPIINDLMGEFDEEEMAALNAKNEGASDLSVAFDSGIAANPMNAAWNVFKDVTDWSNVIDKDAIRERYPDATEEQIEQIHDAAIGEQRRRRTEYENYRYNEADVNPVVGFAGDMAGGLSPVDLIPVGRATTIGKRMAEGVAENVIADTILQGGDVAYGAQDEFRFDQSAMAAGTGAALQGGIDLGARGGRALVDANSRRRARSAPSTRLPFVSAPTAPRRARDYKEQIGQSVQQVADVVNHTTQDWDNAPETDVFQNFNHMPKASRNSLGIYNAETGRVALNTEMILREAAKKKMEPAEVVNSVLFHEGLGHYGLAQQFGDELDASLRYFYDNGTTSLKRRADEWLEQNPDAYVDAPDRTARAMEEIFAEMSEKGQLPRKIVDRLADTVKQFARRMGIKLKYSTRELNGILSMAHRAVADGAGRDVRGNGYRFMYAGPNARTANQNTLLDAEMNKAFKLDVGPGGETRRDLGWFEGRDGKWRFEINDRDADWGVLDTETLEELTDGMGPNMSIYSGVRALDGLFDPAWREGTGLNSLPLGTVLEHPKLFEAYPELRDYTVRVETDPRNAGSFDPRTNTIYLADNAPGTRRNELSTLLHEIQHGIQSIEGYTQGGNSRTALRRLPFTKLLDEGIQWADNLDRYLTDLWTSGFDSFESSLNSPEFQKAHKDGNLREMRAILRKASRSNPILRDMNVTIRTETPSVTAEDFPSRVIEVVNEYTNWLEDDLFGNLDKAMNELGNLYQVGTLPDPIHYRHVSQILEGIYWTVPTSVRWQDKSFMQARDEAYYSLLGELEARDTQARRELTDEQRKVTEPYSLATEDLPIDQPIVGNTDFATAQPMSNERSNASLPEDSRKPTRVDDRMRIRDNKLRRGNMSQKVSNEVQWAKDNGVDPAELGLPSDPSARYMRPSPEADSISDEDFFEMENAKEILDAITEGNVPTYGSRVEAQRAARDRGITKSQISKIKGVGNLDKVLFQYDHLAERMNEEVTRLYAKMKDGTFTKADKAKYLQTIYKFNELIGKIFNDQAEVGRALSALNAVQYTRKNLENLNSVLATFDNTNVAAFADDELFERFATQVQGMLNSGNPVGANTMVKSIIKPYWWQYVLTFRHTMMLSGLATHAKNLTDNAIMISRVLEEKVLAGLGGGAVRKALRAAGKNVEEGVSGAEVAGHTYGLIRAMLDMETFKRTKDAFIDGHGNHPYSAKIEMQDARIAGLSKVNDALYASDIFFRAFHNNAALYSLGVREAQKQGFTGKDAFEEGANIATNPTAEMIAEANALTDENLLVDSPSGLSNWLEPVKAIRPNMSGGQQAKSFAANMFFPFLRVTDRLLFQALRRSPLAFLDKNTREDFKAGGARRDIALARASMGSALMAWYWYSAEGADEQEEGAIQGAGPVDYKKGAALEAGGYRPNSVIGNDEYVDSTALNLSFLPWDLQNNVAASVATLRDRYEAGAEDEGGAAAGMAALFRATLHLLGSQTYAENLSGYVDVFNEARSEEEGTTAMASFAGGMASQFVPAIARQYAQGGIVDEGPGVDTVKRSTRGDGSFGARVYGRVTSGIPGMSSELPARRSSYGDTIPQGRTPAGMNNSTPILQDDVSRELTRIERSTDDVVVSAAPSSFQFEGSTVRLTDVQRQEWQRVQGGALRDYMRESMDMPVWRTLTMPEKVAAVQANRRLAYDYAKEQMLPELGLERSE